jgi:fatty-acyl-CoA synthase
VVDSDFELGALHQRLEEELAGYARPIFIRLQREMQITGTFKHRKVDLVEEGFDPDRISDLLYFRDPEEQAFVTLDRPVFERIVNGEVRI